MPFQEEREREPRHLAFRAQRESLTGLLKVKSRTRSRINESCVSPELIFPCGPERYPRAEEGVPYQIALLRDQIEHQTQLKYLAVMREGMAHTE